MRTNGTGSILKLGGKRKKPYAIRITTGWKEGKQQYKYLGYFENKEEAEMTLHDFLKMGIVEPQNNFHFMHDSRLYRIWWGMIGRCEYPSNASYKWYGSRGISVCAEWRSSFQNFYEWAMSHGYDDTLTIDRIDNDGNYEPNNCRWATYKEQVQNRRKKSAI